MSDPEPFERDRTRQEPLVNPDTGTVGDWRAEIVTASGFNVLAGIWLIVSPFLLGYVVGDAMWNPIVCGALVLVLALVRVSVPATRTAWSSVVNMFIGVWLFLSAFWLAASGEAVANSWIIGLIVFGLAVWSALTVGGH